MIHDLELEAICFIQQFRTPLLDQFFRFLDFFDRQEFLFVLIPIIWLGQGWKAGLRLFYILLLSSLANHALKEFFLSPRPFHLDPNLAIIQVGGLGFPSGAAQTVILLSGLLLSSSKSAWKWIVALSYIVFVSFSRVYLGLHFPTDILAGWVVGFGLLGVYFYIRPYVERVLARMNLGSLFLLSQVIPFSLLVWQQSIFALRFCSVAMGIGMGVFVIHSYQLLLRSPQNTKEYVLRAVVGVFGTFSCYGLTLLLPTSNAMFLGFARFFVLGVWVSLGNHLVCRKLFAQSKATLQVDK